MKLVLRCAALFCLCGRLLAIEISSGVGRTSTQEGEKQRSNEKDHRALLMRREVMIADAVSLDSTIQQKGGTNAQDGLPKVSEEVYTHKDGFASVSVEGGAFQGLFDVKTSPESAVTTATWVGSVSMKKGDFLQVRYRYTLGGGCTSLDTASASTHPKFKIKIGGVDVGEERNILPEGITEQTLHLHGGTNDDCQGKACATCFSAVQEKFFQAAEDVSGSLKTIFLQGRTVHLQVLDINLRRQAATPVDCYTYAQSGTAMSLRACVGMALSKQLDQFGFKCKDDVCSAGDDLGECFELYSGATKVAMDECSDHGDSLGEFALKKGDGQHMLVLKTTLVTDAKVCWIRIPDGCGSQQLPATTDPKQWFIDFKYTSKTACTESDAPNEYEGLCNVQSIETRFEAKEKERANALANYVKTSGSTSSKSYCSGSYDLTKADGKPYDHQDAADCARQCEASAMCVHFVFGLSQSPPCRLSSTCLSYTDASSIWDGYKKQEASPLAWGDAFMLSLQDNSYDDIVSLFDDQQKEQKVMKWGNGFGKPITFWRPDPLVAVITACPEYGAGVELEYGSEDNGNRHWAAVETGDASKTVTFGSVPSTVLIRPPSPQNYGCLRYGDSIHLAVLDGSQVDFAIKETSDDSIRFTTKSMNTAEFYILKPLVPFSARILSGHHDTKALGMYFNFDWPPGLATTFNGTSFTVKQCRDGQEEWEGTVKLSKKSKATVHGNGHGRREPESNAAADQWKKGDIITTADKCPTAADITENLHLTAPPAWAADIWHLAAAEETCEDSCRTKGLVCDDGNSFEVESHAKKAFLASGVECHAMTTTCEPIGSCDELGAPSVNTAHLQDLAGGNGKSASPCYYSEQVSSCQQQPIANYRRLCGCQKDFSGLFFHSLGNDVIAVTQDGARATINRAGVSAEDGSGDVNSETIKVKDEMGTLNADGDIHWAGGAVWYAVVDNGNQAQHYTKIGNAACGDTVALTPVLKSLAACQILCTRKQECVFVSYKQGACYHYGEGACEAGKFTKEDDGLTLWAKESPMCDGCADDSPVGDCLAACQSKTGYCARCDSPFGTRGACCRKDDANAPSECRGVPEMLFMQADNPQCVLVTAEEYLDKELIGAVAAGSPGTIKSIDDCRVKCLQDVDCLAFSWHSGDAGNFCNLKSSGSADDLKYSESTSTFVLQRPPQAMEYTYISLTKCGDYVGSTCDIGLQPQWFGGDKPDIAPTAITLEGCKALCDRENDCDGFQHQTEAGAKEICVFRSKKAGGVNCGRKNSDSWSCYEKKAKPIYADQNFVDVTVADGATTGPHSINSGGSPGGSATWLPAVELKAWYALTVTYRYMIGCGDGDGPKVRFKVGDKQVNVNGPLNLPSGVDCALQDQYTDASDAILTTSEDVTGALQTHFEISSRTMKLKVVKIDEPEALCINGVTKDSYCCPVECGTCGGSQCGIRPGGETQCCTNKIRDSGKECKHWGDVACFLNQNKDVFLSSIKLKSAIQDWCAEANDNGDERKKLTERYGHISQWDVGKITDMSGLFAYQTGCNEDISTWDTSSAISMEDMFKGAQEFDRDIGMWNTAMVTKMEGMFKGAKKFNQNISAWDTAQVTTMKNMFYKAEAFDQDISNWNTEKVTQMESMFEGAKEFSDGSIKNWDIRKVLQFYDMFEGVKLTDEKKQAIYDTWWLENRDFKAQYEAWEMLIPKVTVAPTPQPTDTQACTADSCIPYVQMAKNRGCDQAAPLATHADADISTCRQLCDVYAGGICKAFAHQGASSCKLYTTCYDLSAKTEAVRDTTIFRKDCMLYNVPENERLYTAVFHDDPPGVGFHRSMIDATQAWRPKVRGSTVPEWLQMNLAEGTIVVGVAIQGGRGGGGVENAAIKAFKIKYRQQGADAIAGNTFGDEEYDFTPTHRDEVVSKNFDEPIVTNAIQIVPVTQASSDLVSLRAAVWTCQAKPVT